MRISKISQSNSLYFYTIYEFNFMLWRWSQLINKCELIIVIINFAGTIKSCSWKWLKGSTLDILIYLLRLWRHVHCNLNILDMSGHEVDFKMNLNRYKCSEKIYWAEGLIPTLTPQFSILFHHYVLPWLANYTLQFCTGAVGIGRGGEEGVCNLGPCFLPAARRSELPCSVPGSE